MGINPQLREERKVVYQDYNEKKKAFENLNHYLQSYQKMAVSPESLTPKRKAVLANMLSEYRTLKEELEELDKRKQEIDEELNRLQYGRVKVADIVYPGVQITIGQAQYHVNDPVRFVLFTLKDGDIKIEPLR